MSAVEILDPLEPEIVVDEYRRHGLSSIWKLARLRASGEGPAFLRVGRKIVYTRRDVEDWLGSCRIVPNKPECGQ